MSSPLRVGIDLTWLRPGVVGGSEELLVGQLRALASVAGDEIDPVLFALPDLGVAHPDLAERIETVRAPVSGRNRVLRIGAQATWMFTAARRRRVAVLHAAGGTVPLRRPAPTLVTVHDLQYLAFPQHFSTVKLAWLRTAVPAAVRRAAAVAVTTASVQVAVEEAFPAVVGRVCITPPVIATRPLHPGADDGVDEALRARYRLRDPFVVFPAITYRHKGHLTLLEAMARLAGTHPELTLLLLGGEGPAEADVAAAIVRLGLRDRVRRPGRVPAGERDAIVRRACALVFPSRFEGLGLPVLEAMALGCPVIASDAAALPETVGGAGLLVPPQDPEAWAEAIAHVVDDPGERALLAAAGREHAAAFTPERAAADLVEAYRRARS